MLKQSSLDGNDYRAFPVAAELRVEPRASSGRPAGAPTWSAEAVLAAETDDEGYHLGIVKNTAGAESTALDTSVVLFDAAPVFEALLDDKAAGVPVPVIARRFHDAFVEGIVQVAQLVDMMYGVNIVTLSGGVFMNRYLLENAASRLASGGFSVAINRELPPNDASVSFGEAVVALARNTQTA
jgi:hydrogenase maturation protein HypF